MTFRVEITAEAERDADAILDWLLSEHAGETGMRWFAALHDAIATLAELPARCPLAPENAAFPFEVRHLLYMAGSRRFIGFYSRLRTKRCMYCIFDTAGVNGWNPDYSFSNCLAITNR